MDCDVSFRVQILEEVQGLVDQVLPPAHLAIVGGAAFKLLENSKTRMIGRDRM